MNDYKILKFLGKGAFGRTFLAEKDDKKYVMKLISLSKVKLVDILAEVNVLQKLNKITHCDVRALCLVDHFKNNENEYVIITNYIDDSITLREYMDSYKDINQTMGEDNIKILIKCLIEQLNVLHENGVVHNDIKPENILIVVKGDKILNCLLIDFGMSCFKFCKSGGTISYLAPELFRIIKMEYDDIIKLKKKLLTNEKTAEEGKKIPVNRHDFMKCDIYSLGIVFYEILHNRLPYLSKQDYIRDKEEYYKKNYDDFNNELLKLKTNNKSLYKAITQLDQENQIDTYILETLPNNLLSPDSILSYYNFYKKNPKFNSISFNKSLDNIINLMLTVNPLNRPGIKRIKKMFSSV